MELWGINTFQSTPSAWRETWQEDRSLVCVLFQSTPSAWRETSARTAPAETAAISIHSLRMEGDSFFRKASSTISHFNPLPPHGGRLPAGTHQRRFVCYFNPLPPHGGRLISRTSPFFLRIISIHSLRMEGDMGELIKQVAPNISIHSLRMEGDG